MVKLSVETVTESAGLAAGGRATAAASRGTWLRNGLAALASLRLTVVLFALSIILVFCGTLAQIDAGIWTVVNQYFRSLYVWIPLQLFFPRRLTVPGSFPFPGGWLVGGLLLLNLVAAHLVRFKLAWRRAGILLIHAGLIVMMVSELVTGLFALEGTMSIDVGKSANYVEHTSAAELAIIDRSDPYTDAVVVIPGSRLRKGGLIRHELLPFDVQVVRYMANSASPKMATPDADNPATAGDGLQAVAVERPEATGTDPEQKVDIPSAYVTLRRKGTDESLGTYLVSEWLTLNERPQKLELDGRPYELYLRFKRSYKPYALHLVEFRHDRYLGTDTPKNFSSKVRLTDPVRNEDREVLIWMNHPLRYEGETFYQSSYKPDDSGTILQVVRNPGWLMPYLSCAMVSLGMLLHFGLHLFGFLQRRAAQ